MTAPARGLRETVDQMVEDAIRRILPTVMNEVLLRTIASSGVMSEVRREPSEEPVTVRVPSAAPRPTPKRKAGRPDLSRLLDETAGSEFYERSQPQVVREEPGAPTAPLRERVAQNLQSLPPELREMAEGLDISDDGGEMWDDEPIVPRGDDAGNLDVSARRTGVDFDRMRQMTQIVEAKKPRMSSADVQANAQFEETRLKRMREQLDKPAR